MKSPDPQSRSHIASGIALASELAKQGRFIFTTEEAKRVAAGLGMPESGVWMLLTRLADAGWIVRLRRGLYAGTGQLPGGVDVPSFVLATALVRPSAIALWSALAHHDLTDQVPIAITAITPRKVVTPTMRSTGESGDSHAWYVAGLECRYVTLVESRYAIGLERVWADERFTFCVTDRERTVLDAFAMPGRFGGISEGLGVLGLRRPAGRWTSTGLSHMRCSTAPGRSSSVWDGVSSKRVRRRLLSCRCCGGNRRPTLYLTPDARAVVDATADGSSS